MRVEEEERLVESERPTKPCASCGGECAGTRRIKDRWGRYFHRACYEKETGPILKPCAVCGWECADRPRVRDKLGRYFHNKCYEKAKRRTQARREAAEAKKAAAAATAPASPALEDHAEAAPVDIGSVEYVKPVILILAGVTVFAVALLTEAPGAGVTRGIATVAVSLTVLAVCAVLGAVVVGLAAKRWLGDCGPMTLILLRVAGIYAVVHAVALVSVVAVPGAVDGFGLIVALIFAWGLTAWLFKLDFMRIGSLALFAVGLNSLTGLALKALAAAG